LDIERSRITHRIIKESEGDCFFVQ